MGDPLGMVVCSNFDSIYFEVVMHVGRFRESPARAMSDGKSDDDEFSSRSETHRRRFFHRTSHARVILWDVQHGFRRGSPSGPFTTIFLAETFSKRLQFHGRLMTRDHQLFSGSAIPIEHIPLAVPCALEDLMCTKARAGVPRS